MGLLLISGALFAGGIVLFLVFDHRVDWLSIVGMCFSIFFGMAFFACFCGLCCVPFIKVNKPIEYSQFSLYVESLQDNERLTDNERLRAVKKLMTWNSDIEKHRARQGFWVGIYYPSTVADLELFDINQIPDAKYQLGIETE